MIQRTFILFKYKLTKHVISTTFASIVLPIGLQAGLQAAQLRLITQVKPVGHVMNYQEIIFLLYNFRE